MSILPVSYNKLFEYVKDNYDLFVLLINLAKSKYCSKLLKRLCNNISYCRERQILAYNMVKYKDISYTSSNQSFSNNYTINNHDVEISSWRCMQPVLFEVSSKPINILEERSTGWAFGPMTYFYGEFVAYKQVRKYLEQNHSALLDIKPIMHGIFDFYRELEKYNMKRYVSDKDLLCQIISSICRHAWDRTNYTFSLESEEVPELVYS